MNKILAVIFFNCLIGYGQIKQIQLVDLITETNGLIFENGEFYPLNINEIEKKVRFFIEEKYPKVVVRVDNLVWDSYKTKIGNSSISHEHTFIANLITRDSKEVKFIEVKYNPFNQNIYGYFKWSSLKNDFVLDRDYEVQLADEPDLYSLGIANQKNKPSISDFTNSFQRFVEIRSQKNNGVTGASPVDIEGLSDLIESYVEKNYSIVQYVRNIVWDSYETYISPYSKHHYHTFVVQVKVESSSMFKYFKVLYNPTTKIVNSDFYWDQEGLKFIR